jgi:hypothetical protein
VKINTESHFSKSDQVVSKSGYIFYLLEDNWSLDKNINIPVSSIFGLLKTEVESGFIKTLATYAQNYSSSHVQNIFFRFLHYLRSTKSKSITPTSLINYKSNLTKNTQWYLGTIRGFLRKWHDLGYAGISDEVIELLDGWVLKGNVKGDVIKRLDPLKGPLSDLELQAFNEGVIQAFESDDISLTDMALGLVISNTGRRPIQISHLRIKDVLNGKNNRNETTYLLNVPRAKQRATDFRQQFKQFAITNELWVILSSQADYVIHLIEKVLGFKLQQPDRLDLPLFPDMVEIKKITSPHEIRVALKTDHLHIKSSKITSTCRHIADVAKIYSERTGELLNISSNRFRYTAPRRFEWVSP